MSKKQAISEIIEALGGTPPSGEASLRYLLHCIAEAIDDSEGSTTDLIGYAKLNGATFTGAVSGIAPTANAHFATKKYVDDAISAAIAALDGGSGSE